VLSEATTTALSVVGTTMITIKIIENFSKTEKATKLKKESVGID